MVSSDLGTGITFSDYISDAEYEYERISLLELLAFCLEVGGCELSESSSNSKRAVFLCIWRYPPTPPQSHFFVKTASSAKCVCDSQIADLEN